MFNGHCNAFGERKIKKKIYLLNSPHLIEILNDSSANGSNATIIKDHDSTNNLKTVNEVINEHIIMVVKKKKTDESIVVAPNFTFTACIELSF